MSGSFLCAFFIRIFASYLTLLDMEVKIYVYRFQTQERGI